MDHLDYGLGEPKLAMMDDASVFVAGQVQAPMELPAVSNPLLTSGAMGLGKSVKALTTQASVLMIPSNLCGIVPQAKIDCSISLSFKISTGSMCIYVNHPGMTICIPATSGKGECMNNPGCIDVYKEGPLPPGEYLLHVSDISTTYRDPIKNTIRNWFGDWGSFRVALNPQFVLPPNRTGNFFIHGGSVPGSAGCIDCGGGFEGNDATKTLVYWLLQDHDGEVLCTVTD